MVSKNIVIKIFMNTTFHYLSSLAHKRYWCVGAWQGFVVLFENRRNVGFFSKNKGNNPGQRDY